MSAVRLWPHYKKLPRGWRLAEYRLGHHARHSILIERKPKRRRKRA